MTIWVTKPEKKTWNRVKSKQRRALLFLQLEKLEEQKCPPFDSKLNIWLQHAQITLLVKSRLPPFWFLMENIFGSVDVKITPDFCSYSRLKGYYLVDFFWINLLTLLTIDDKSCSIECKINFADAKTLWGEPS